MKMITNKLSQNWATRPNCHKNKLCSFFFLNFFNHLRNFLKFSCLSDLILCSFYHKLGCVSFIFRKQNYFKGIYLHLTTLAALFRLCRLFVFFFYCDVTKYFHRYNCKSIKRSGIIEKTLMQVSDSSS